MRIVGRAVLFAVLGSLLACGGDSADQAGADGGAGASGSGTPSGTSSGTGETGGSGAGSSSTGASGGSSSGGGPGASCDDPLPEGTKYYVDGSCPVAGDGLAEGCATSDGAPGAFVDPQSCFDVIQAGETCLIKDGTYVTSNDGGDPSEDGGFALRQSGTADAPIVIRSYPGHSPLLANCPPDQTSYCPRPTISALGVSHAHFDCLRVRGGFAIFGDYDYVDGVASVYDEGLVIQRSEITTGWGEVGDGNWAAIAVYQQNGAWIHHNDIHDVSVQSGGEQQSSGSCIKLYHNTGSVIEYNTCKHVDIAESQAGGIDDKAQAIDNVHRYNWIEDVPSCFRLNNQLQSSGVSFYQNVCIAKPRGTATATNIGIRLLTNIDGVEIYGNVVHGFEVGFMIMGEDSPVAGVVTYNNIFSQVGSNNLEAYAYAPSLRDYNAYWPGSLYLLDGSWAASLSDVQAATPFDDHSLELDCGFVSPGTDFELISGSPCAGAGRTGGTPAGDPVDLGPYVDGIGCVGHDC